MQPIKCGMTQSEITAAAQRILDKMAADSLGMPAPRPCTIDNAGTGHRSDTPMDMHGDPVNDLSTLSYSPAPGQNAFPGATLPIFFPAPPLDVAGAFDPFDALWRRECGK